MSKLDTQNLTLEEKLELADQTSRGYFRSGLNCSECVLRTFMDMHDVNFPDEIIALASGFGGGIGHTKNTCGAVSGAVLALGTVLGRRNPFENESVAENVKQLYGGIYPKFADMVNEVKDNYGTIICSELSDPMGDWEGKTRKKNCMAITAYCSQLAEKHANKYFEDAEKSEE